MYSMEQDSIELARSIRKETDLLIAGGPLPTAKPSSFIEDFDLVVVGEAENTMIEIVKAYLENKNPKKVPGIIYKEGSNTYHTGRRNTIENLDSIPFPARELFDNDSYKQYYRDHFGYTMTSMISSRGCPFRCDFCSRPIFKEGFRSRSHENIVNEMQSIMDMGYDLIWFADDCFTISKERVLKICDEVIRRGLNVKWQCLSRVDAMDQQMAGKMKDAGCQRVYFGIESGDQRTLHLMKKDIDLQTARSAVYNANKAGIETGAFLIIGYPGESEEMILNTIHFGTTLPLDYLSFTLPYPIPGTGLYEKVKDDLVEPRKGRIKLIEHTLEFKSQYSEFKLKFAILKGTVQFRIRKYLGQVGYELFGRPFEKITDLLFKMLK
ncbi:B12-binding domain-containing radical SAM protein [Candidatus Bathyarchaeota archaeon]|nr:B12-binding domain-containing radical SAM protein [Candidatus Bathyarchaeota archaeon]